MKRFIFAGMMGMMFMVSGCYYRTCPTYTRQPEKIKQLQRMHEENAKVDLKKV